jgi:outer membrane lipoprotein SlyB
MIAGGVLGGLLGHQVGSGRGNTAATIIGAAGGAYAGHQVEKNVNKGARYNVDVRMSDGSLRTVSYDTEPGFKRGDQVRLIDGKLIRN